MWGKLLVVFLSIMLSVATELYFPIDENDPVAKKQKHFWAIIFLIFSLVLGLPIEQTLETEARVDEVKAMLKEHEKQTAEHGQFEDLYALYEKNFGNSQPALRGWADELLNFLRDNWSHGVMPLPREFAPAKIGDVYYGAKHSIIATSVGSTKYYFGVHTYILANEYARDHGVPVIRFYIYGKDYRNRIELRNGKHPADINEFFAEVKDLHETLGSLYSAVIDVDDVHLDAYRDLLIMDNSFVAETELSPEWGPIRAVATENPDKLREARQYFHVLFGAVDQRYVVRMKPEQVRKYFKRQFSLSASADPAESLFNYVMGEASQ